MPGDPVQRCFQRRRGLFAQGVEYALIQFSGIHAAGAINQVVGFIDQYGDAPVIEDCQPVEQGGHVEIVVVVAYHQIRPAAQLLAEVVGADTVFHGDAAHGGLIEPVFGNGLGTGGRQAVVEAFGERAGFSVAGLVRVLAGLVAGDVLQYAQVQWCLSVRTQALQGV